MPRIIIIAVLVLSFSTGLKAQSNTTQFIDTFRLYSVTVPKEIEVVRTSYQITNFVTLSEGTDDTFRERVMVEISKAPPGYSLDTIAAMAQQQVRSLMKNPRLIMTLTKEISGEKAKVYTFDGGVGDQASLRVYHYVLLHKDILFRITYMEDSMYKLLLTQKPGYKLGMPTICESLIESMKFLQ